METFTVVVTLTVHQQTDEYLQTKRAIRDEVRSWLEGLNARVQTITVEKQERTK